MEVDGSFEAVNSYSFNLKWKWMEKLRIDVFWKVDESGAYLAFDGIW